MNAPGERAPQFAPLDIPDTAEPPPEITPLQIGGVFGEIAHAACVATQTSQTFGTLLALSALATIAQRARVVEVAPGWIEPLSWWSWLLAPSGERKTQLVRPLLMPMATWQKLVRDLYRSKVASAHALREVAESRIEKLKRDAANAKKPEERTAARREIEQELELMPAPVYVPRAFTESITSERMVSLLAENGERIALWTDEGGQFALWAGLYSGGAANLDPPLKGYDGSPLVTDRQTQSHFVAHPAFTMAVAMQPTIFEEALGNRRFLGSGLLARASYAYPKSNVGRRDVREPTPIPAALAQEYERTVHAWLDVTSEHRGAARVIAFDDEARRDFLRFRENNERDLGADGQLAALPEWGSKLPGKVARMAALIEIAQNGLDVARVTGASLRTAWAIGDLLIPHARAVFLGLGGATEQAGPRALLAWLRARDWPGDVLLVNRHEAHRSLEHRFRTAKELNDAARVLTAWGVLSAPITERKGERGGRPSTLWAVNPEALQ